MRGRALVPPALFELIAYPRFSPDGRYVLFVASGGDRSRPRLRLEPTPGTGLDWAPSVAAPGPPMDHWLVEVATGRLELLAALASGHLTAAWSPDGESIAYLDVEGLAVLDLTSGTVTRLVDAPDYLAIDWTR